MHIRPIVPGELERFARVGTPQEHTAGVRQYLDRLLAVDSTQPGWCFVAEENGQLLCRTLLWATPGASMPSDLVLLEVPWDEADLALATQFLKAMLARMHALGAHEVGYVLDTPPQWPQWQLAPERRGALLERAGFTLARETLRFEWRDERDSAGSPLSPASERLSFRTLEEVGADAFVEAIARVTAGTFDRRLRLQREELGAAEAARTLFELVRALGYEPGWWRLAYTATGQLAGLLMLSKRQGLGPDSAVIGYIGVVPEQRGHGYSDGLLAQAAALARASGITTIVADTDTGNAPMANAFRHAGYAQFATRREYFLDLSASDEDASRAAR